MFQAGPSALVFLVNDASNTLPALSKVNSAEAAVKLFSSGMTGISGAGNSPFFTNRSVLLQPKEDSLKTGFSTLLKETNAPVFVVNASRAGKSLKPIVDGVVAGGAV